MDDNEEKEADDISAFKDFLIKLEGGKKLIHIILKEH